MTRKIIQIQDIPETGAHGGYLLALCDDGTVWYFSAGSWTPHIEQIPQEPITNK